MYKIKTILAVLLCGGLFTACERDYNAELSVKNEMPHYVYISSNRETLISATDSVYKLKEAGKSDMELNFNFTVRYGMSDDKTATVETTVGQDFSLVEEYNKSMSKNLQPLPETFLSFPTTSANIPSGSNEVSVSFKLINIDNLPDGEYLLPITIKSANASNGFPLHKLKKTAYYHITKTDMMLDKSKAEMIDCSDFHPGESGGKGKDALIDGDPATFWHSDYESPKFGGDNAPLPHWLRMDMKSSWEITKIKLWRRSGACATDTKSVIFKVNDELKPYDDPSWQEIGKIEYSITNTDEVMKEIDIAPEKMKRGRYLLLFMNEPGARGVLVELAEIDVYIR
ncbi:MAG: DUF1735 domain-containing protein [Dysgonamonadaceae bacterium]|jgi:hypothetical protein|nr:DUF1735 domain-containing protein [Dysgonamonadaceae bacterium]